MRKLTALAFIVSICGRLTACSSPATDSAKESTPPGSAKSLPNDFTPRSPEENILGAPSKDGLCNPSVIDIDHERNTANFFYHGQPGDRISIEIFMKQGASSVENFELGSTNTSWQLPTNIYNGDIDYVKVSADGRVGKPGSCKIMVN